MSQPAVRLDHVWKRFRRGGQVKSLAELAFGLPRAKRRRRDGDGLMEGEFWALRDVSFAVAPGEVFGIIGPNGAGKSTTLKLLSRILRPERGRAEVQDRVCGLIELGAGFHPYLSGRENVFINGAILGMKRAEIRRAYDAIVEFAGLAEFMDMPVKDYSSGMYARLGFAVAAHAEPDVLLVDEVLAVGDTAFQLKCWDWMTRRRKQGTAIVIVSHDMHTVRGCNRALYLNGGVPRAAGDAGEVVQRYMDDIGAAIGNRGSELSSSPMPDSRTPISASTRADIASVEFLNRDGAPLARVQPGDALIARLHFTARDEIHEPVFALSLYHDDPRFAIHTPANYLANLFSGELFKGRSVQGPGVVEVEVPEVHLPVGWYRARAYLYERDRMGLVAFRDNAARIECVRPEWSDGRALVDLRQHWREHPV
jgi:ABC-type polysaccharide/polyol phosphate transport system ATPase subunit